MRQTSLPGPRIIADHIAGLAGDTGQPFDSRLVCAEELHAQDIIHCAGPFEAQHHFAGREEDMPIAHIGFKSNLCISLALVGHKRKGHVGRLIGRRECRRRIDDRRCNAGITGESDDPGC